MTEIERERKPVDKFTFETLKHIIATKGKVRFKVASGSMEPLIAVNSEIDVYPLQGKPKKFDIIVFWDGQILTCHYVRHVNAIPASNGEELFVTGGLDSRFEDWPVRTSQILGILKEPVISGFWQFRLLIGRWWK